MKHKQYNREKSVQYAIDIPKSIKGYKGIKIEQVNII